MEELDKAIAILLELLFKVADRWDIDKTIKEAVDLLQKHKRKLRSE